LSLCALCALNPPARAAALAAPLAEENDYVEVGSLLRQRPPAPKPIREAVEPDLAEDVTDVLVSMANINDEDLDDDEGADGNADYIDVESSQPRGKTA
jgi:hypothetical protein